MAHVCDNPTCEHHIPLAESQRNADRVLVEGERRTYAIDRFKYQSTRGESVFLCQQCHRAVQLVTAPAPDNPRPRLID